MPYPETVNLPFNRSSLPDGFILHPTPQPADDRPPLWVLLQGGGMLLQDDTNGPRLPEGELPSPLAPGQPTLAFASYRGFQVRATEIPPQAQLPSGLVTESFNAFRESIPADLMTIAGIGKQLLHWQRMNRFCSRCGTPPQQLPDSWGKRCPSCGAEHFPHIHPCAIVLIRRDDQLLMIRKPEWAQGRYSLVAGFLDVGESLEECAIREAKEETGITIKNLQYITSQCWPFPSQLMAGFVAEYGGGGVQPDDREIEDARWFTIGALPSLPARRSIARYLIDSHGTIPAPPDPHGN